MDDKLNGIQEMIAKKTVCIVLVRGESPEGEPIFAYVAVRADRLMEFMAAQQSGVFYPEDFGVVIEAGEGEPSAEVRARMRDEYSFNEETMFDIPDAAAAYGVASNIDTFATDGEGPEEEEDEEEDDSEDPED